MKSNARRGYFHFVQGADESNSVHFSMTLLERQEEPGKIQTEILNFQIPSSHLNTLITTLKEIQENLSEKGVNTGKPVNLFPSIPYDFTADMTR